MTEKHDAAYWWATAAYFDELDAEAVRRGHINQSIKFADSATECRYMARCIKDGVEPGHDH